MDYSPIERAQFNVLHDVAAAIANETTPIRAAEYQRRQRCMQLADETKKSLLKLALAANELRNQLDYIAIRANHRNG